MVSGRYSRRRRRAAIERASLRALLAALLVAGAASAQPPDSDSPSRASEVNPTSQTSDADRRPDTDQQSQPPDADHREDSAAVLDEFLDEVRTLTAEFEQQLLTSGGDLLETSSGSLALSRPDKFRWHYEEPIEQWIVADGENLWMYDVELEQVTVTPLEETAMSSPAMLLSGDEAAREGFEVVETFTRDGLAWVRLRPEVGGADFTSVLLAFDDVSLRRLEFVDGLNQVTRIEFSDVAVNPELDEETFEFEPPAGADVSGSPG